MKRDTDLTVGMIVRPQGIKGEVKVQAYTDYPERFSELKTVIIRKGLLDQEVRIEKARYSKTDVFLQLEGVDNRDSAEELRSAMIFIRRDQAAKLPSDAFYIVDLIGCVVKNQKHIVLGTVYDIIETGSNDVYIVKGAYGDLMVPALKTVVQSVDVRAKEIIVDTQNLEGLFPDGL